MATVFPTVTGGGVANLCTAQVGNGVSTNILDRGGLTDEAAILKVTTTIGATPTCTYLIEASVDGTNWFACPYADTGTPGTPAVATFVITTATTVFKHLLANFAWRYLRVTMSANTNVTSTIDVWAV